jgi:uncharacterized protein
VSVFVDTSAFYAVLDASDACHKAARRTWTELLDAGESLVTTNYVLVETTALLQHRIGMVAVETFVADVEPVVQATWVDAAAHRVALHGLLVAGRRRVSLVDSVSFHVMREQAIRTVFCFDPHFAEQGFMLVPAAGMSGSGPR